MSLKAAWISRLLNLDKPCPCVNIANYWYCKIGFDLQTIVRCNFKTQECFPIIQKIPVFYRDIVIAYNKCKTVRPVNQCNPYEIATDVIWGNERYKYKGKCLHIKSWIEAGIIYIKDILGEEGNILRGKEVINLLKNKKNWIAEYCMVKNACKSVEKVTDALMFASVNLDANLIKLFSKNKTYDVLNRKSGFFYSILRDQMQKVWCKHLDLECLNFQQTWNLIFHNKVKICRSKNWQNSILRFYQAFYHVVEYSINGYLIYLLYVMCVKRQRI